MRMLLLAAWLTSVPCLAEQPTPPATAPDPAADDVHLTETEPPPEPGKRRVLALELQATGLDAEQARLVDELLAVELARHAELDVLSGADVRRMVELEADKQSVGCEDSSCLAEIAGAMGARYVVHGRIGKLGSRVILTLNLFDSETAGAVGRAELKPDSIDELPDELKGAVDQLLVGLLEPPVAAGVASASDTAAAPTSSPPAATGGGALGYVWPAAFAVLGGGLAAGGAAFDLLSPTSDDAAVDGWDALGPSLVVVGVGAAVFGFVFNPFAGGDDA